MVCCLASSCWTPCFSRCSVVVVDEAQEPCYTNLLLSVLKKYGTNHSYWSPQVNCPDGGFSNLPEYSRIQAIRKDLRVAICSATFDAENLRDYFNASSALHSREDSAIIASIEGRIYPVEIAYIEQPTENYITSAVVTVMEIHLTQPRGDILVFLTGKEEINESHCGPFNLLVIVTPIATNLPEASVTI